MKLTVILLAILAGSVSAQTITVQQPPANASNTIGFQSSTGFRPTQTTPLTITIQSAPVYGQVRQQPQVAESTYVPRVVDSPRWAPVIDCSRGCDFNSRSANAWPATLVCPPLEIEAGKIYKSKFGSCSVEVEVK